MASLFVRNLINFFKMSEEHKNKLKYKLLFSYNGIFVKLNQIITYSNFAAFKIWKLTNPATRVDDGDTFDRPNEKASKKFSQFFNKFVFGLCFQSNQMQLLIRFFCSHHTILRFENIE